MSLSLHPLFKNDPILPGIAAPAPHSSLYYEKALEILSLQFLNI